MRHAAIVAGNLPMLEALLQHMAHSSISPDGRERLWMSVPEQITGATLMVPWAVTSAKLLESSRRGFDNLG